jgi:myo-inositol-1(or 4)-monophosphatase
MNADYSQILQTLVHCSERVRQAVVSAEHATFSEIVGIGADGADTSRIDYVAEEAALSFFQSTQIHGNVLSEEVGFVDRGSAITYILDPIDSTSNATASAIGSAELPGTSSSGDPELELPRHSEMFGFPYFAFSVAAMIDDRLVAACVRNLPTGDLFTASLGAGTRYNGVIVSPVTVSRLADAWVALIRPSKDEGLRRAREIIFNARRIRITGCSALDIALISTGSLHALVNPNAHRPPNSGEKVVDYAGGQLILQEAGGVITDTEGRPLPIDHDLARLTPVLAAATPELHRELIASIHGRADHETKT